MDSNHQSRATIATKLTSLASLDQPEGVELGPSDRREAAAIFIPRGDPMLSDLQRRIDEIRPRPGDATEDNQTFLVGNRADRINHHSGGRSLEQPQGLGYGREWVEEAMATTQSCS